jgi:VWFA-related protein
VTRPLRVAAAVLTLGLLSASPQGQTFRAVIQGVSVNVSVVKGKEPIAGLTDKDFELRDNGVRQQIAAVSLQSVPIDMTVVLDTSESVEGEPFERLKEDVKRISANLGPADRFRFLTFGSTVAEVSPMQPRGDGVRNLAVSTGGSTAFYHAILAAMLPGATPGRPHLVVVLSDGMDNVSLLNAGDLIDIARRSDCVLYVLLRQLPGPTLRRARPGSWFPFAGNGGHRSLIEAVETTGGRFERHLVSTPLPDVLARAITSFRESYVLWYTPTGVDAPGWHELSVRVPSGKYTIRARRGYYSAEPGGRGATALQGELPRGRD